MVWKLSECPCDYRNQLCPLKELPPLSVEAIKRLIEHLPPEVQTALARWMSERDGKTWDDQIEQDFSTGGAGVGLLEEMHARIDAGATLESFKVTGQRG
jgi:hypothetical protein